MRRTKVDISGMQRKLRQVERNRPRARAETVRHVTAEFVEELYIRWPRDTNRSIRGWMLAARQAGARTRAIPALEPSGYRDTLIERFEDQLQMYTDAETKWQKQQEKLEAIKRNWYTSKQRKPDNWSQDLDKRTREAKRIRKKMAKRKDRAAEELQALRDHKFATVIFGRKRKSGGHRLHTTRTKVYGGSGRIINAPGDTYVMLVNHEPHARFIERSYKAVFRAFGMLRSKGGRRLKASHAKSLLEGVA